MKVRIGVGLGAAHVPGPVAFAQLVDDLDQLGFDSIWLPEVLSAPTLDPLAGLAFAAAHNHHLKLGTTMLLPGRNLVRLAKELATLDVLSNGRLLCTFVPGLPRQPEAGAVGVPQPDKGRRMDEMLPLLRRLWAGEAVTHHGESADIDGVTVAPLPVQQPLEVWTGGMVPAALRRCGRYADGWLPSSCTPDEVAVARRVIDESAARSRPDHRPRALRSLHRLRRRSPVVEDQKGSGCHPAGCGPRPGGPGGPGRPAGHAGAVPRCGLLQVRGPTARITGIVAGRTRTPGRRRPRPPGMSRSRPLEFDLRCP